LGRIYWVFLVLLIAVTGAVSRPAVATNVCDELTGAAAALEKFAAHPEEMTLQLQRVNETLGLGFPPGRAGALMMLKGILQVNPQLLDAISKADPVFDLRRLKQTAQVTEASITDRENGDITLVRMKDGRFYYKNDLDTTFLPKQARMDDLTGLLDFKNDSMVSFLERVLNLATRQPDQNDGRYQFALMYDLMHLKKINNYLNTTGLTGAHATGDFVLSKLSEIVRDFVGNHGIVGRVGGDEFAILFTRRMTPQEMSMTMKDLQETVFRSAELQGLVADQVSVRRQIIEGVRRATSFEELPEGVRGDRDLGFADFCQREIKEQQSQIDDILRRPIGIAQAAVALNDGLRRETELAMENGGVDALAPLWQKLKTTSSEVYGLIKAQNVVDNGFPPKDDYGVAVSPRPTEELSARGRSYLGGHVILPDIRNPVIPRRTGGN
jgi:diguanylate cyclase (GGDEF)-like protein